MNIQRGVRKLQFMLLGLAFAICQPGVANAQLAGTRASFSLPFAVQWGVVVLQPGEYTLTLPATLDRVVCVRGNNQTVLLSAQEFSDEDLTGQSSLILVRSGGKYFVRALSLARFGVIYYWPPKGQVLLALNGKGNKRTVIPAPELIQRLPVMVAER